jgi:hypothetical protein
MPQDLAVSLISTMTSASADVGITPDAATAMGNTISSLMTSSSSSESSTEGEKRSGRLSNAVNALTEALWVGKSEGEEPLTLSTRNLKIMALVGACKNLRAQKSCNHIAYAKRKVTLFQVAIVW